MKRFTS